MRIDLPKDVTMIILSFVYEEHCEVLQMYWQNNFTPRGILSAPEVSLSRYMAGMWIPFFALQELVRRELAPEPQTRQLRNEISTVTRVRLLRLDPPGDEYNDQEATLGAYDEMYQLWRVILDNGKELRVKADQFEVFLL